MNVSQLQPHPPSHIQVISKEASEREADFLALRLLNRRARVRLSPEPLDLDLFPRQGRLFAVANSKGWFAAATRISGSQFSLVFSPLSELHSAFSSTSDSGPIALQPQRSLPLNGIPHILVFAHHEDRLLVGLTDGSILVFDAQGLLMPGAGSQSPLHVFHSSADSVVREISPNPGDIPELVAVLRDVGGSGNALPVEIFDVHNLQSVGGWQAGDSPGTRPSTLSWSPRGKQLALGLQSGEMVTFSPTAASTVKTYVPVPPSVSGQSVISATWLSNTEFHTIYASPGPLGPDAEQSHFVVTVDSKTNTATDVKLNSPYLPFPGLRPPGLFPVTLRNWVSARFLFFVGDSTSSDIGLIGSLADASSSPPETWVNLSLEETSTPTVPLDKDMNDTVLLGLELDLTSTRTYHYTGPSGEELEVPPPPIMYAYASDGTLTGWHVVNTTGVAYPGMITASPRSGVPAVQNRHSPSAQGSFNQPSPFSTASAFKPVPSPFTQSSPSPLGSGSAFGQSANSSFASLPSPNSDSDEDAMASDANSDEDTDFGGLSLGGGESNIASNNARGGGASMFGQFDARPLSTGTGSTFGVPSTLGAGAIKPASGFGAFVNQGPSAFGQPSSSVFGQPSSGSAFGQPASASAQSSFGLPSFTAAASNASSAPTFGQTSFGRPAAGPSAFGQPAFGKPAFGQPAFGQSAFAGGSALTKSTSGETQTPASSTASSGGGFSAFAQAGPSAFSAAASKGASAKPVWAALASDSKEKESAFFARSPLDGSTSPSPFGKSAAASPSGAPTATSPSGAPVTRSPFSAPSTTPSAFGSAQTTSVSHANASENPNAPTVDATPSLTTASQSPGTSGSAVAAQPVASPFSSSSAPKGGAFGGLVSTPSGFGKFGVSFGAFGNATSAFTQGATPAGSSPSSQPVSAFGSSTTTPASTPPKEATAKPAFGAPSALGAQKSVFGSKGLGALAPSVPTTPAVPAGGGFAAFSGGTSAFGTGAASGGSFGDLLRKSKDGESQRKDEPKTPVSVFSKPPPVTAEAEPESQSSETAEQPKPASVFSVFARDPNAGVVQGSSKGKERESPSGEKPVSVFSRDSSDRSPQRSPKGKGVVKSSLATPPGSPNAGEVYEDESEEDYAEHYQEEGEVDDDAHSFLSETFSDDSGGEHVEIILADSDTDSAPPSPTGSAEGSTTASPPPTLHIHLPEEPEPEPEPEMRKPVFSAPPSPASESPPEADKVVRGRESSTTPPGTPSAPMPALPITSSAPSTSSVSSLAPSPVISPFGIGPRPSTRPARSSPLASQPINGDDDSADDASPIKPKPGSVTPSEARPASISTKNREPEEAKSRPKTPPLQAMFDKVLPPTSTPFSLMPPGASLPPFSLPKLPTPGASATTPLPAFEPLPSPGNTLFGSKTSALPGSPQTGKAPLFPPPPSTAALTGGTLGTHAPLSAVPSGGNRTPSPGVKLPSSFFPVAPTPGKATAPSAGPALGVKPTDATGASKLSTDTAVAEGMQAECAHLFITLAKELEELRILAQDATRRREAMTKPSTAMRTRSDLKEPTKWVIGDVAQFGQIIKSVERDIKAFEAQRAAQITMIQELEGNMLKASTREEEIVRFSKASKDTEFAKMLKARTLGPEYLETRSQLRRDIKAMRDRLQLLEDHIQSSKKRLSQMKKSKPSIKPPSLDTINRIYRNIDLSIGQQEDGIAELTARAAKLKLDSQQDKPSRDKRLPDKTLRPLARTPSVAMTTAAALNAEMSANKLKRALLAARKEPMLNTSAIPAEPLPRPQETPQKAIKVEPVSPDLFAIGWDTTRRTHRINESVESDDSGSPYASGTRTRSGKSKYHAPPVQLRKTPSTASPSPPPPNFSWGPLPSVTPMKTLSSDVRPGLPSLSSSWVTEGFGAKS